MIINQPTIENNMFHRQVNHHHHGPHEPLFVGITDARLMTARFCRLGACGCENVVRRYNGTPTQY